jgi:hypothetical protein
MGNNDKVYICNYRNCTRERQSDEIYCWICEFINSLQYDEAITKEDCKKIIKTAKKRLKKLRNDK